MRKKIISKLTCNQQENPYIKFMFLNASNQENN